MRPSIFQRLINPVPDAPTFAELLSTADLPRVGVSVTAPYSAATSDRIFTLLERWVTVPGVALVDTAAKKYLLQYCRTMGLNDEEENALAHLVMCGTLPVPRELEILRGRFLTHSTLRPSQCARFFARITGVGAAVQIAPHGDVRYQAYPRGAFLDYLSHQEPAHYSSEAWLLPSGELILCGLHFAPIVSDETIWSHIAVDLSPRSDAGGPDAFEPYVEKGVSDPPPSATQFSGLLKSTETMESFFSPGSPAPSSSPPRDECTPPPCAVVKEQCARDSQSEACSQLVEQSAPLVVARSPGEWHRFSIVRPPLSYPFREAARKEVDRTLRDSWNSEAILVRSLVGGGGSFSDCCELVAKHIHCSEHPSGAAGLLRTAGYVYSRGSFSLDPELRNLLSPLEGSITREERVPCREPRVVMSFVYSGTHMLLLVNNSGLIGLPSFRYLTGENHELDDFSFDLELNLDLGPPCEVRFCRSVISGYPTLIGVVSSPSIGSIVVRDKTVRPLCLSFSDYMASCDPLGIGNLVSCLSEESFFRCHLKCVDVGRPFPNPGFACCGRRQAQTRFTRFESEWVRRFSLPPLEPDISPADLGELGVGSRSIKAASGKRGGKKKKKFGGDVGQALLQLPRPPSVSPRGNQQRRDVRSLDPVAV